MIIGVPSEVLVRRTARVRLGLTVAGCEATEVLRTARVRDGVVVSVTGAASEGVVTVPLLLIIVGSVAADGIVRFPIERICVAGGAVTAAAVVGVVAALLGRMTVAGFAARVGEGTPIDDCVGVGVPMMTCDGDAEAADAVVTGAVAIAPVMTLPFVLCAPVPATVAAAVMPVVVTVAGAVVPPPLTTTMPVSLSLMTAGVASELMERLTVI